MAKAKAGLILFFVAGLAAVLTFWLDRSVFLPTIFGVSVFLILVYFWLDPFIMFFLGAQRDPEPRLQEILTNLAAKAGIKTPQTFVLNNREPKIFSLAGGICLSTGLRSLLNKSELENLLAREMYFLSHGNVGLAGIYTLTSWQETFAADAFAAQLTSNPEALISALEKIGQASAFDPPVAERVKLLKEM